MTDQTNEIPFFDMVLDAKNLEEDAMRLFAEIRPAWKKDDLAVENYSEGYVNCLMCFRLRSDEAYEDAIVLRVYGGLRDEIRALSSDRELGVLQLAQHAGCFRPIQAVFSNGVAYLRAPGRTLTPADLLDPKIIRIITRKLVAFHHFDVTSIPLINHKGMPWKLSEDTGLDYHVKRRRMLSALPESLPEPERDSRFQEVRLTKDEIYAEHDAMIEALNELNMNITLCHGDIHIKNMVYDEKSGDVMLLDYEMVETRQEGSDLAKVFSFRPILETIGMIKPEEPEITPEVRLEWIRCYLEAKYTHFGKDPADIPEVLVEFSDVEHAILEAYNVQSFVTMFHLFCGLKSRDRFPMDPIEQIPAYRARWGETKKELPTLVARYKQLKEECNKLGLL